MNIKLLYTFLVLTLLIVFTGCPGGSDDLTPEINLKQTQITFDGQKLQTQEVSFSTNTDWQISIPSTASWLQASSTSGKAGNVTLSFSTVEKNNDLGKRSATIIVRAGTASENITVFQEGSEVLTVDKSEITFESADTKSQDIVLETNVSWTLSLSNSSASEWLEVSKMSGGEGKQTLTLSVKNENTNPEGRDVDLVFKTKNLTKKINVLQKGNIIITVVPEFILADGVENKLEFTINTGWKVVCEDSWIKVTPLIGGAGKNNVTITTLESNVGNENRIAKLEIISTAAWAESETKAVSLIQKPYDKNLLYAEGEVIQLAQATKGKGVNLVFMGDGFTLKDMARDGTGKYEKSMRQAVEHYFEVQPYKMYRDYFNVFMVAAISKEEGISGENGTNKETAFKSKYASGTSISCDYLKAEEYGLKINQTGTSVVRKDLSVILILNSYKYAGTCAMWSDGLSVAMCPMSASAYPYDFRGVVNHEAGGHGFAKLADEYINYQGQTITTEQLEKGKEWQGYGYYHNIDFTSNKSRILWKDFFSNPKYSDVGAYEGGFYYSYGVWRAEDKNCMINNIPYFSAQSRWLAVKRMMEIAGQPFTFEQFMETDIIDKSALAKAPTKGLELPPLGPPVLFKY